MDEKGVKGYKPSVSWQKQGLIKNTFTDTGAFAVRPRGNTTQN